MIELWEAAKRANLSGDELDSLKVRLTDHGRVDPPFWLAGGCPLKRDNGHIKKLF